MISMLENKIWSDPISNYCAKAVVDDLGQIVDFSLFAHLRVL